MRTKKPPRQDKIPEKLERIREELAVLAADLRPKVLARTRPFVVEFSGTPKSGKTTITRGLDLFLRRNGFTSRLIGESGSVSPISDKRGFAFNIWTAATTLTWLLEALDAGPQFIIIDRGIFDSTIWARWHFENNTISFDEKSAVENFFMMERWRAVTDVVFLLTSDHHMALHRETAQMLTTTHGRIMNKTTLEQLLDVSSIVAKEKQADVRIVRVDTTHLEPIDTGAMVVRAMFDVLRGGCGRGAPAKT